MMKFKAFFSENRHFLILFALSTGFFVFQHWADLSWDFSVYVMNAKYWVGGDYFEITRAPLQPFLLLIFSIFGWKASEYIFIVFTSALFAFSISKLSNALKIRKEILYFFCLTPFVLSLGLIQGTELLSLAMLILSIAFVAEKKPVSGVFLGLAFLSRYSFMYFLPLLLFNRKPKKVLFSMILFVLPALPWFAYNLFATGNWFSSIAELYAIGIKCRHYIHYPISLPHILMVLSYLLPLFLLGLFYEFGKWENLKKSVGKMKISALMLLLLLISFYQYVKIPLKDIRYVFPFVLPIAYFSYKGFEKLPKKVSVFVIAILAFFNLAYSANALFRLDYSASKVYFDILNVLEEKGIQNCNTMSNIWPLLSYYGKATEPVPRENMVGSSIDAGNFLVIFPNVGENLWERNLTFLREFPVVFETDKFIILGDVEKCSPHKKVDKSYLTSLQEYIQSEFNYTININPCFVLFEGVPVAEKFCNLVNLNGFALDENRLFC